jgi:hypothetical protein
MSTGISSKFADHREAIQLAEQYGIVFEREHLTQIVSFLTNIMTAPASVSALPPAALVEGILGHLYVYNIKHPGLDDQAILAALDEVAHRVRTGALARMGGVA